MGVIEQLRDKVATFERGLSSGEYIKTIIEDNEAYIVEMNSEEQLYEQGINRLGVSIADYAPYSPITIDIKKEKGQPYDRVTLRDYGDFHSSFYIDADNEKFKIGATDEKTDSLVKKYSAYILGLTEEHKQELIDDYIAPELDKKAHEIILQR